MDKDRIAADSLILPNTMKNPSFREGAVPLHEFPTGVRVFRMEDLVPEVAARLLGEAESPESQARLKAAAEKGPHQYGVSDSKLPEDAMAVIIRDPNAPFKQITVFQRDRLTDHGMAVARAAMFEDELAEPNLTSRRSLLVWENQTVKLGNVVTQMHHHFASDQPREASLLRPSGEELLLPELGKIQFVK